jgi:lactate 2-monooxygenase
VSYSSSPPHIETDLGCRTHSVEITQSLLKRAKANGYTALVLTVDTMVIGWRPHDHGIPYSPAGHGFGVQQGISDPVFMGRFGLEPRHERPPFPYTQESIRNRAAAGDPAAQQAMLLGKGWVGEIASGIFRSWDEIQFIKDNWDGPIILKGILAVEVTSSGGRSTSTQFLIFIGR